MKTQREDSILKYQTHKKMYEEIKLEKILEMESCCEMCNRIFYIEDDADIATQIFIKHENGVKFVEFSREKYTPKEFILKYKEKIGHNLCDFDHLTEKEQRERGILKETEAYSPKKKNIGAFALKDDMIREIKKCQLVCCYCHILATMKRCPVYILKGMRKIKTEYIYEIKKKGCSCCGYKDENVLRFFEFDHIDPESKIESITNMAGHDNFTLDEIILEIEKTNLLCRFCHRIRSKKQRKNGEIHPSFRFGRDTKRFRKKSVKNSNSEINENKHSDENFEEEDGNFEEENFEEEEDGNFEDSDSDGEDYYDGKDDEIDYENAEESRNEKIPFNPINERKPVPKTIKLFYKKV